MSTANICDVYLLFVVLVCSCLKDHCLEESFLPWFAVAGIGFESAGIICLPHISIIPYPDRAESTQQCYCKLECF